MILIVKDNALESEIHCIGTKCSVILNYQNGYVLSLWRFFK